MKKTTALGIISLSLLAAAACSDDEGTDREVGAVQAAAGTTMTTPGAGGAAMTNNAAMGGSTAMVAATNNYGTAFTIDGGNVVGTAEAIGGNIFPVANGDNGGYVGDAPEDSTASHIAAFSATADEICMSGSIKQVPGTPPTYDTHWGVQAGLNLNVPGTEVATPDTTETDTSAVDADAGVAGDAGVVVAEADAAVVADEPAAAVEAVPVPWDAGSVIGFSFTITGDALPPSMRFLGAPSSPDITAPGITGKGDLNFCANITPFNNNNIDVLFSEIVDRCWGEAERSAFVTPLDAISWQIPADVGAASNYDYDFCISNIRAIVQ